MDKKEISEKVAAAIGSKGERKFKQSVEMTLSFKDINIEDAKNKLNLTVVLPKGRGKEVEVGVFAEGDMNVRAKKLSKHVLNKIELEQMAKDKRKMRKYVNECYCFISSPDLMASIGKSWGIVLGPRSKMPQPIPPNVDLAPVVKRLKDTVRIKSKKNPAIHVVVGVEDMQPHDIAENITAVLSTVERQIPKENFKSSYVKTSMGGAVRLW